MFRKMWPTNWLHSGSLSRTQLRDKPRRWLRRCVERLENRTLLDGEFGFAIGVGSTSDDFVSAVATDGANVYVTGQFFGTVDFNPGPGVTSLTAFGSGDVFVAKYTSSGVLVYARQLGGTSEERGSGIAVDRLGNVYTTGGFDGTADFDPGAATSNLTSVGDRDIFVSKLDSAGNFVYARQLGGALFDIGVGIAVDGSGNVYTTGSIDVTRPCLSYKIFVSKLDSSGNLVFTRQFGGTGCASGFDIALDGTGNVYTTGLFDATTDFDPGAGTSNLTSFGDRDVYVSKLDSAGNFVYARQLGGTSQDESFGIAVDGSGNVYTSGTFSGTADFDPGAGTNYLTSFGGFDIFVSKLDSAGDFVYARQLGGTLNDRGFDIAVDGSRNVYTTGDFWVTADFDPGAGTSNLTSFGDNDIFVSKLDSSGNFVSARQFGGTTTDRGFGIALDGSGNVYSIGDFAGTVDFDPGPASFKLSSVGSQDGFVLKLIGPCSRLVEPARVIPVSDEPTTMDKGDFNKDGNVDLVVDNGKSRDLSILLGQGDGTFLHKSKIPLGNPSGTVVVGDFDNDGLADIAAAILQGGNHVGPGFVTVFSGNGDATFDPGIQVMGSVVSMHGLVTRDFNRDGKLDLAGTDYYQGKVAIALGNGDGSFGEARTFSVPATGLLSLIAADMNRDGIPDLVVPSRDTQRLSILYSDGSGGIAGGTSSDATSMLEYVTVGDFNQDGWLDLAASHYVATGVSILLSDGTGSFRPLQRVDNGYVTDNLAAVDINADGRIDLALGVSRPDQTVALMLGQGDGTFGQPIAYEPEMAGSEHRGIVVGHFNSDQLPDIAVAAGGHDIVSIFLNDHCNAAPELGAIGNRSVNELERLTFTATANDSDVPANSLSFSLDAGAPAGAAIDAVTGVFTWTPTEAQGPGSYPVTIRVTDNGSPAASDSETITITVTEVNVAPELGAIGNRSVNELEPLTFTATASDPDVPANSLSFSLDAGAPAGAAIDAATGVFTWTPTEAQGPGSYPVTIRVTDNGSPAASDSETITVSVLIAVRNRAPRALNQQVIVREDGSIVITLGAFDPDDDLLSYSLVTEPGHGCWDLDAETGELAYRPHDGYAGPDSFEFLVSDGELESDIATGSITVTPLVAGFEFTDGVLTVIGTAGNDSIRLVRAGRGYNVVTNFGTFNVPSRATLQSVVVRGRDGNDMINLTVLGPSQRAEIRGDSGNDQIFGGASHDILLGDAGNDAITGGRGDDLIIGGTGSDRLVGSTGNDILIGGVLDDPCHDLDLVSLLNNWRAAHTTAARLTSVQPFIDRLLDDHESDLLTGGIGIDTFVIYPFDRIVDRERIDLVIALQS